MQQTFSRMPVMLAAALCLALSVFQVASAYSNTGPLCAVCISVAEAIAPLAHSQENKTLAWLEPIVITVCDDLAAIGLIPDCKGDGCRDLWYGKFCSFQFEHLLIGRSQRGSRSRKWACIHRGRDQCAARQAPDLLPRRSL